MKSLLIALCLIPVCLSAQVAVNPPAQYTITITVRPGDPEYPKPQNLREVYQQLQYPKACSEKDIEGKVVARLKVDAAGNVIDTKIMRADHPLFEAEVQKHLKAIRFEARENGPNVWVTIPFQFKLGNKSSNG